MMCPNCGGLKAETNKAYGYAGKWCECKELSVKVVTSTPVGWKCPVCNAVNSPYIENCSKCIKNNI